MDETTLKNANEILIRFISDTEAKVRYGLRQRQDYFDAIERGEEPDNYRVNFITATVNEVFGWLAAKGEEFAKRFPQDRLSSEDMKDILATAHHLLTIRTSE